MVKGKMVKIHLSTVSTNSSNIMPSAVGLINPVETFTCVNNLYMYQTRVLQLQMNKKRKTRN